ncbi:MAG TPA: DUF5666 domain-containing protein [Candidatus Paceibacterota bacterium]|nr:DUF5666 domain-containing protein [Candidatus Paceibacterota bacterium]
MKKIIPIFVAALLMVGAGAFYGGMKYGQTKKPSFVSGQWGSQMPGGGLQNGSGTGARINGGSKSGGGLIAGEITAKDDKSITVKSQDGSSKIIFYSESMEISKSVSGILSDLAVGENVTVMGKTSQDGSITAQSIQLRSVASPQP